MKHKITVDNSSTIASLEYDFVKERLIVEFIAGSKYFYNGVDSDTARELFEADSKGKYFAANVKDKFDTEKIGATLNPPKPWRIPPPRLAVKAPARAHPAVKATPAKPQPTMSMWPFPTNVSKP